MSEILGYLKLDKKDLHKAISALKKAKINCEEFFPEEVAGLSKVVPTVKEEVDASKLPDQIVTVSEAFPKLKIKDE